MTCRLVDRFLPAIRKIAGGDVSDIPQALVDEEAAWKKMPLSSSRAEGYHRTTRLVKIKGARSRMPWIMASARVDQDLDFMDVVEDTDAGMECFRAEFSSFAHILQTRPGSRAKHLEGYSNIHLST